MKEQILIVEDEINILNANKQMLKRRGYDVFTAETVREANSLLEKISPDLLILDVMLPDGNGFEICENFRKDNRQPILFLSAKSDFVSRVDGIKKGGDYYLTKPYHFEELLAVITRLLERQSEINSKNSVSIGELDFDFSTLSAKVNNKETLLTKIEATLLSVLIQNVDKEISRETLYEKVWGATAIKDTRVIKTHISRLRQKINCDNTDSYDILAVYGKGYIFVRN